MKSRVIFYQSFNDLFLIVHVYCSAYFMCQHCEGSTCYVCQTRDFFCYLLFSTVTCSDDAFTDLDDDRLGTSIRHQLLDQFVTSLELLLNAFELDTFYNMNRRADRGNFNDSEIMEKDEDLTSQMPWGILTVLAARSLSCHHLPPLGSIPARGLPHILWETYL